MYRNDTFDRDSVYWVGTCLQETYCNFVIMKSSYSEATVYRYMQCFEKNSFHNEFIILQKMFTDKYQAEDYSMPITNVDFKVCCLLIAF